MAYRNEAENETINLEISNESLHLDEEMIDYPKTKKKRGAKGYRNKTGRGRGKVGKFRPKSSHY